jgi:hypothetical protein
MYTKHGMGPVKCTSMPAWGWLAAGLGIGVWSSSSQASRHAGYDDRRGQAPSECAQGVEVESGMACGLQG